MRQALQENGWFTVIDYLFHVAEENGHKQLAKDLDRAGETLRLDIEHLGGTPDASR